MERYRRASMIKKPESMRAEVTTRQFEPPLVMMVMHTHLALVENILNILSVYLFHYFSIHMDRYVYEHNTQYSN